LTTGTGNSPEAHDPVVLAAGGDLKNALAIVKQDQVVPGPHVGDLATPVAQEYFKQSIQVLTEYLEASPEIVAVDPHPEYFSRTMGLEMHRPVEEVFHHHAHAVSLLFQYGLEGPALFAVFDGTGYGTDGTIWGGEFLLADRENFSRLAHIGLFPLPGGEAAIREPMRILAGLLAMTGAGDLPKELLSFFNDTGDRYRLWIEAIRKNINVPLTSSAGRLFDAAAAAIGFRNQVTFEGEAAMWLEGIADPTESNRYEVRFGEGEPFVIDPAALILKVTRDILHGVAAEKVAARFHNTMAGMIADTLSRLSRQTGITTVGLTGGCFQNELLTERTAALLEIMGYTVLVHETVPPNDGGIALGQAVAARSRWRKKQE
jgi:hydrogenase maturation protein HypF